MLLSLRICALGELRGRLAKPDALAKMLATVVGIFAGSERARFLIADERVCAAVAGSVPPFTAAR